MCQCIFCLEEIDNPSAAVSLGGDRMHPVCYDEYMEELAQYEEASQDEYGVEHMEDFYADMWGDEHLSAYDEEDFF